MTTGSTVPDIQGDFKEAYAKDVVNAIPESSILTKNTTFVSAERRSGNEYHQPVILSRSQGITFAGPDEEFITLNPAISLKMPDARLLGSQLYMQGALSDNVIQRSKANSFIQATKLIVKDTLDSHGKYLEDTFLYGQTSKGNATSSVNASAISTVVQFTTASWSDMRFAGMTNAKVSFFKITDGSLINQNTFMVISAVDTDNKRLTITGNATDIGDLDTYLTTADDAELYWYGSRTDATTFLECAGLYKIMTNAGTLFNISASTYDLWRGNTRSAAGELTSGKLDNFIAVAAGKGLDEDVDVLVNPKTWSNLNTSQSAKRVYDKSYSDAEFRNGAKKITFVSQNGLLNIWSAPYVKEGDAFIVALKQLIRVGAAEVSFDTLGGQPDMFLTQMDGVTGYFFRTISNQALLATKPAQTVLVNGIVNV